MTGSLVSPPPASLSAALTPAQSHTSPLSRRADDLPKISPFLRGLITRIGLSLAYRGSEPRMERPTDRPAE
ncbi:uncharacterized protein BO80DRAFT_421588 [Aspergillus ibericus CBS 121593]|uniref:Uncharacterized protein n=1 Tax=Aspergillus ibericus CBS 121593 TaxID=1448316 RepID=A0A395HAG5_9EURO|nr:hypothetical protein BO80DRAFT_421588 [Aspergillus ibericus CBS 121593]RAL04941.1 hypothetical protein BO80DRAFT_421588 [Aspergillus ibericus CBS 121593]